MTGDEIRAIRVQRDLLTGAIDAAEADVGAAETKRGEAEGRLSDLLDEIEDLQRKCPHPAMIRGEDTCPDCGWEDPG